MPQEQPKPPETFWMICNKRRIKHQPPRKVYKKLAEVQADAKSLSEKFPGQSFYVLQSVHRERIEVPEAEMIEQPEAAEAATA